jgi:hypothetical protein
MSNREPGEISIHSFVVRIWLEEPDQETKSPLWDGQITLVATGEQQRFRDLETMSNFVAAHLQSRGVDLGLKWRLHNKFDAFKRYVRRTLGKIQTIAG